MTLEEKARWLSDYYARVAEGEEMLLGGLPSDYGPAWFDEPHNWTTRKPKRGLWVIYNNNGDISELFAYGKPDQERYIGRELVYLEESDAPTT